MNEHMKSDKPKRAACIRLILIPIFILLPSAAYANIYVPTLVEMITSPLVWSVFLVTMVITVPVIAMVGFIEAFIIRRDIQKGSFRKLFLYLCLMNALTSIKLPDFGPNPVWPALPIAFVLTIPIEALIIRYYLKRWLSVNSFIHALKLSIKMNTASYAVISIIVIGLIYIPVIGIEHTEALNGVSGRLVIYPCDEGRVLDVRSKHFIIRKSSSISDRLNSECCTVESSHSLIHAAYVEKYSESKEVRIVRSKISGSRWITEEIGQVKQMDLIEAVSRDGGMLLGQMNDTWVLYDVKSGTSKKLPYQPRSIARAFFSNDLRYLAVTELVEHQEKGDMLTYSYSSFLHDLQKGSREKLGEVLCQAFSFKGSLLVWNKDSAVTIYDYKARTKRTVKVHGRIDDGWMAWSPDGRKIAYCTINNPYITNHWTRDIRIVDIGTGASATLFKGMRTYGRPVSMEWLD